MAARSWLDVHPRDNSIDELLAAALRGETPSCEFHSNEEARDAAIAHGVAGLLIERADIHARWPSSLVEALRVQARAQAMWELRHRQLLTVLLGALAEQTIPCLILKGTAIAYDLYENPAARARGDTDLLIGAGDVTKAKAVLAELGYKPGILGGVTDDFALQQSWTLSLADGGSHVIDLHWQVMNAPSLKALFSFESCCAAGRDLPRLAPTARTIDQSRLLIHACLHRAMQYNAPYFIGGNAYFEPDRLIWVYDIHLLATSLGEAEWSVFCALTAEMGVCRTCLEGLQAAQARLGTPLPDSVVRTLQKAGARDRGSHYFRRSHALARAWQDVRSIPGFSRKLRYMVSRVVTTEPFLRAAYPDMPDRSLAYLYGRRLVEMVRGKAGRSRP